MDKKYKRIVNLLEEAMKSEESWRKNMASTISFAL